MTGPYVLLFLGCLAKKPPEVTAAGPPFVSLPEASADAFFPTPPHAVVVSAEGAVWVDGSSFPGTVPGPSDPVQSGLLSRMSEVRTAAPSDQVLLSIDEDADFHAVRQVIQAANAAGFKTLLLATQPDPGDPTDGVRAFRVDQAVPGNGGSPILLGSLDKSLIDAVIKADMSDIRHCYEVLLGVRPRISGQVTVRFVIRAAGTVSTAEIKSNAMPTRDERFETCLLDEFRSLVFPEPRGGGIVIVAYPFIFEPAP